MKELKRWMKGVHESAQQDDDDESAGEDDVSIAGLEGPTSMSLSASQSSNGMFSDQSLLYPTAATDAAMFDYSCPGSSSFATPNEGIDTNDMSSMLNTFFDKNENSPGQIQALNLQFPPSSSHTTTTTAGQPSQQPSQLWVDLPSEHKEPAGGLSQMRAV